MTTTLFDSLSHADFLRLTLRAFSTQGYTVEPSRAADADGVLLGKNGARIAVLCKKYRGAFIGRPVLQQFYGAMRGLKCREGYLVTTTDCSPDAYEYAKGKGISLYNRERTTELLRTAFGDEFIRSGRMPDLGRTAGPVPPATRQAVSVASYEKVPAAGPKKAVEPVKALASAQAPKLIHAPEPVQAPEPIQAAEPAPAPGPIEATRPVPVPEPAEAREPEPLPVPEQVPAPEPIHLQEPAPEPEKTAEPEQAPPEKAGTVELPEEVQEVQELPEVPELQDVPEPQAGPGPQEAPGPGIPEAAPSERTTIIVCLECNKRLQVPIDQGMITVQCPECGMRRVYQPELNEAGELKTTTVITCTSCKQKLNVPTNRGQLNVRCPQCKAAWVFTP